MDLNGIYYRDGFIRHKFDATKLLDVVGWAEAIQRGGIDPYDQGYRWESKYPDTWDFRPSAVAFDSDFIDALIDNDVPAMMEEATNSRDLTLCHCQLRLALPRPSGQPSYMPWHRDTYLSRQGTWVGNQPPVHKLIVYLDRNGKSEQRLHVVKGSHRCMFDDPDMDITRYNQLGFFNRDRVETINASNSEALFFNTSLLHSVINEVDPEGSIRVIYSFGTYRQFMENFAHMQPHIDIQQMYEAKR